MADKKYAVEVRDVRKHFFYSRHKNNSLKRAITQIFKKKDLGKDSFYALDGISFNVEKGDFFGILGRNGSGKSTLLKIISEIYQPSSGTVKHNGKLVSFIELGVGFKPELTGRENVYLNGALLGFSKEEIDAMYDNIVAFAELEDFMGQQLKNYSSGMKVRLAFSVAIRAHADILILDEVLAVGDAAFRRKCSEYFATLKSDRDKTVILVTHGMEDVRQYCNKAVVIENGKVIYSGSAGLAADRYLALFDNAAESAKKEDQLKGGVVSDVTLSDIAIIQDNKRVEKVRFKNDFSLELKLTSESLHDDIVMGVHFYDQEGRDIVAISSKVFGSMKLSKGINTVVFDIQNIFPDGKYYINFAVEESKTKKLLIQAHGISPFKVEGINSTDYSKHSLVYPEVELRYENK